MDWPQRTTYDFEPSNNVSDDIRIGFSDIKNADKKMSRTEIAELPDYADLLAIYKEHKEAYLDTLERGKVVSENYRTAMQELIRWRHFDMMLKKRAFYNALINILSRFPQLKVEAELREAELRGRTNITTPTERTDGYGGSRTRRSRRSRITRRTRRSRRSIKTRRTRI